MDKGSHAGYNRTTDIILPAVLLCVLALFIVAGNALIFLAACRTPLLRTTSNFFLVSLAVADFIVGAVLCPVYAFVNVTHQGDHHPFKPLQDWLWIQTVLTSTFNLTALSVDRYIAVTRAFRYTQLVTTKRCVYAAAIIWTIALSFASVRFLIHDPSALPPLWAATTLLAVFFPFVIISYCYFHILKAARFQRRQIAHLSVLNPSAHAAALRNKKAAFTAAVVIGLFALLWTPSLVISFIHVAALDRADQVRVHRVWGWTVLVSFSSSAFNPWVYAVRHRTFRAVFKAILRLWTLMCVAAKENSRPSYWCQ